MIKKVTYKIFNFYHNEKIPVTYELGPYTIKITKTHCNNSKKVTQNSFYKFKHDENWNRNFEIIPAQKSLWKETAKIIINEAKIEKSKFFPLNSEMNNVDDLCLILTFLNGRIVTRNIFFDHHNPLRCCPSPIPQKKWLDYTKLILNKFEIFNDPLINTAFMNICLVYEANQLLSFSAYVSSIFNIIYERHYKPSDEYIKSDLRKSIISEIQSILHNHELKTKIIEDITPRIGNILTPSAIEKILYFMKDMQFIMDDEKDENIKRIKYLNKVRNAIVHKGDIIEIKGIDEKTNLMISSYSMFIILDIVHYYFFTNLFDIKNDYTNIIFEVIKKYIQHGKYKNFDVFNQNYDDYIKDLEDTWINKGIIEL